MRKNLVLLWLLATLCGCSTPTPQEQTWAKECPEYKQYLDWRWLITHSKDVTVTMSQALSPCATFKSMMWQYFNPGKTPTEDEL